jgi:hypothetical protein
MNLKFILRKIIRFPCWYTYQSFNIGLGMREEGGGDTKDLCTWSPRISFHLISFVQTTTAKQINDGSGDGDDDGGGVT